MHEIELKFQVSAASRQAVASAVAGDDKLDRVRLRAAYFDTAGRALAQAGLALRVRREGRRWVQTLKGAGSDGLTREEHNVPLPVAAAAETPQADPGLHAGTPVGERLIALLASDDAAGGLVCSYRTDIHRRVRQLTVGAAGADGSSADARRGAKPADDAGVQAGFDGEAVNTVGCVELAFDEGAIAAGDRRLPVCELEIELMDGSPLAVIDAAWDWVGRHGLWLDTRSKAERGDLLARGEAMAPPRRAAAVRLTADMTEAQAWHAVLLSCFDQIATNASQVADGRYLPEHVHQLRVGLRRLRSALRLFAPRHVRREDDAGGAAEVDAPAAVAGPDEDAEDVTAQLGEQAATLFRSLGAARDADAVAELLAGRLGGALRSVGLSDDPPLTPAAADTPDPVTCVRAPASQQLLLGLLRLGQRRPTPAPAEPADTVRTLRRLLARRLQRWHRQVERDVARFRTLDGEARHRLRKRAKRLRYAVEFVAALYPKKAVAAYAGPLRRLQDRLGELNDLAIAIDACRIHAANEPRALFAMGWLAARRELMLADQGRDIDAFADAKRFWKK